MLRTEIITLTALLIGGALLMGCHSDSEVTDSTSSSEVGVASEPSATLDGATLVESRCSGCHTGTQETGFSRINQIRKTPEGWFMTIVRMERERRTYLEDDERRALVKYLADTQGLAPSETGNFRYILEKQPNVVEHTEDGELAEMCGRCHSNARYSLQRRDKVEWEKLVNFHVAQFPTLEYQAMSADRHWFELATSTFSERLGERFPLQTDAWSGWAQKPKTDIAGSWRVVGRLPGKGNYTGAATIVSQGTDGYQANYQLTFADDEQWAGQSDALVYTGYEWRGTAQLNGQQVREVYALAEDGNRMSGRWFVTDHDEKGGSWFATRIGQGSDVLAVEPAFVKAGEATRLTIHGIDLSGTVDFGEGVAVNILSQNDTEIVADIEVDGTAAIGKRAVAVGPTKSDPLFTIYDRIDRVAVTPDYAIARVGGGGGKLDPVAAQFDAIGYMNGTDGVAGNADDIEIGYLDAEWSYDNADELAAQMEDAKFAGHVNAVGTFIPAEAGINDKRHMATNNVGVLSVTGTVVDGEREVSGEARLVVTVQRFIDPPIR